MAQRPKKRKWLIILLLLLVAYVAYKKLLPGGPGGWGGGAPPVSVAQVLERPVREWHEYSGRITSVDQAEVRPRVSGVIQEVRLAEGTLVQQGDVLFVIDPRPFAAAVTAAEGLLGSAQARLALARADMVRAQKLIKENAIPQFQFDQTRNALNVAEAGVKTAQAELDVAQLNYDYAFVKAPIGGRVSRAEITAGNLVETGPNTPLLTTVVAAGQVYADFDLDEQTFLEYARAHMADDTEATRTIPVKLALMGDEKPSHSGYMKSFDNRINLSTGTIRGRALLENPGGQLVAGMFARIYIGSPQEKPSLLITDRAIGTDQNKKFVMIVNESNKVERREIVLGPVTEDGMRIVRSGLKPGDKVVINGTQRIMMPDQQVTPQLVAMDAKEQPAAPQDATAEAGKEAPAQ